MYDAQTAAIHLSYDWGALLIVVVVVREWLLWRDR